MRLASARAFSSKLLTNFRGGRERDRGEIIVSFVESAGLSGVRLESEVSEGGAEGCHD